MINYSSPFWVFVLLKSIQDKKLRIIYHVLLENTKSMIALNPKMNRSPSVQFLISEF
jgi:hypothetical protein